MKHAFLSPIEEAIQAIAQGKMIVLIDDESRENEGDLVMAAEFASPEAINFMVTHGRGLVCLAMEQTDFERLGIPMMVKHNRAPRQTAFGVSIEAVEGVTTGISVFDRARTIEVAINESCGANDIVMPGHVFPLCAKPGGVLQRNGHTEGGVDLSRLAGLKPAAVICEIMNTDGSMARVPDLVEFAKQHDLIVASIHDLQTYRVHHELLIKQSASAELPIDAVGVFQIHTFESTIGQGDIVVLQKPYDPDQVPTVRLHSACFTGDILGSARCDCGDQLAASIRIVHEQGGAVVYLPQEGRGIGLVNKIKAYALQQSGLDTVEANHQLGFDEDLRDYGLAAQVLKQLNMTRVKLLTNNPRKVEGLQRYGVSVVERVPLESVPKIENVRYLQTKRDKLGHWVRVDQREVN